MTALHSDEYRRFIEAMIAARHGAGLSQIELAKRVALDQSKIAKYETCVRRLDVIEFLGVMRALELDAAEFLQAFVESEARRVG